MKFTTKIQERKSKQKYYSKLREKMMEYGYTDKWVILPRKLEGIAKGDKVEVRIKKVDF